MAIAPSFTYTGEYDLVEKTHLTYGDVWALYLKTTGTLTLSKNTIVDLLAIGGGAPGGAYKYDSEYYTYGGNGGSPGGSAKSESLQLEVAKSYQVTIGGSGQSTTVTDVSLGSVIIQAAGGTTQGGGQGAGHYNAYSNEWETRYATAGANGTIVDFFGETHGGYGGGGPMNYNANTIKGGAGGTTTSGGTPGSSGKDVSTRISTSFLGTYTMTGGYGGGGYGGGGGGQSYPKGDNTTPPAGGPGVVILAFINAPPSDPTGLTYGTPRAGKSLTLTWTASADPEGDSITYTVEHLDSVNNTWTQDAVSITGTSYTATVPNVGSADAPANIKYRVKATDAGGGESGYCTGATKIISYNNAPEISGTDTALGSFSGIAPTWTGTATDTDGDSFTVSVRLDGVEIKSITAAASASGASTANIDLTALADIWYTVVNGSHTIVIDGTDDKGDTGDPRTLTFIKAENTVEVYRGISSVNRPSKATVQVAPVKSSWPTDATIEVWIANNGNDAQSNIQWVSVPLASLGDANNAAIPITMENTTKTADNWCTAVHFKAVQGASGRPVTLRSVTLNITAGLEA